MEEPTIKPVLPVTPSRDVIKKRRVRPKPSNTKLPPARRKPRDGDKGIIDTYA